MRGLQYWSSAVRCLVVAALAASACACGSDEDGTPPSPPFFAVLSAFPAEMAAVLEDTTVEETVTIADRVLRVGTLGGVRVVVGMTGIGLMNATAITAAVLDEFDVTGVIVSGVAGSFLRIGDVAVATEWTLSDGSMYAPHPEWLALANQITGTNAPVLERCTFLPDEPSREVCLPFEPTIVVGGPGQSADPFGDRPFPCQSEGDDVFGCDSTPENTPPTTAFNRSAMGFSAGAEQGPLISADMETAAIAREALSRGVGFIAFRAVSDGPGDPLDLPGFPFQFFAYYRLAARNAALATLAFLEQVAAQ